MSELNDIVIQLDVIITHLDDITGRLERIEKRQITVREEIHETAPPATGSFGTINTGKN